MRITFAFSASILPLIAACSAPEPEAAPVPAPQPPKITVAPTPAPAPVPQPTGKWIDWPLASGDWVYRSDQRGSLALFGAPNGNAKFLIRCDQAQKRIFLSQAGVIGDGASMTLRASSGMQTYSAGNSGGAPAYAATSLAPDDYMLDRIAFSRGRFAVQTSGLTSIAIPIWPEFTRVVEDCRS